MPMRKTLASSRYLLQGHSPAKTSAMTNSSKTFTPSITERLLNRSARKPPVMENRMNGSENSAPMDSPIAILLRQGHRRAEQRHEDDQVFQDIVAEGALELGDDERPETASAIFGRRSGRRGNGRLGRVGGAH